MGGWISVVCITMWKSILTGPVRWLKKKTFRSNGDDSPPPHKDQHSKSVARAKANPFVRKRRSSMCYDEDGHIAHEFYVEESDKHNGRKKVGIKRILTNIKPLGEITLDPPRLHVDMPYVLCKVT
ncbi:tumor suppressor candidate 2-like [Anneissia japonica]|uniref:tumor suppressor candidate 2-like n=1 Tax=Anneissia japonica TaxID=1529436 RepID=UPI001425B4A3|nr:tumor suppressor candidate 2-like [Anneissia japonica]